MDTRCQLRTLALRGQTSGFCGAGTWESRPGAVGPLATKLRQERRRPRGLGALAPASTLAAPGRRQGSVPSPRMWHGAAHVVAAMGCAGSSHRFPAAVVAPPRGQDFPLESGRLPGEPRPGGPELLLARALSAALARPLSQKFLKQYLCAQFFKLYSPCYPGALLLR